MPDAPTPSVVPPGPSMPPQPTLVRDTCLGRLPRLFDPRVPKLQELVQPDPSRPPLPPSIDNTDGIPPHLGMMLNNLLGDCSCAAYYHARQIWSFQTTGLLLTNSDSNVRRLYEQACGYDPTQPGPGPGGRMQDVLIHLLNHGAPIDPAGLVNEKIAGFLELDRFDLDAIKRTIAESALVYVGLRVPAFLLQPGVPTPAIWETDPHADNTVLGGHAVILAGYGPAGARVISWGAVYTMTWAFFAEFVDEVYAIAHHAWMDPRGLTPGGIPASELAAAMEPLIATASSPQVNEQTATPSSADASSSSSGSPSSS